VVLAGGESACAGRPVAAILCFGSIILAGIFYAHGISQAPRPDESARDLYDIDMEYSFESLPAGDHRTINNALSPSDRRRGNSHRSDLSFDKFWNTSWPAGALGLIEFRAIESLPRADWMSSVALLWTCLAAYLLDARVPRNLRRFGTKLHDEYLLPERLWSDLEACWPARQGRK
jgi:uncharacterized protein (DUF2126 family)